MTKDAVRRCSIDSRFSLSLFVEFFPPVAHVLLLKLRGERIFPFCSSFVKSERPLESTKILSRHHQQNRQLVIQEVERSIDRANVGREQLVRDTASHEALCSFRNEESSFRVPEQVEKISTDPKKAIIQSNDLHFYTTPDRGSRILLVMASRMEMRLSFPFSLLKHMLPEHLI